VTGRRVLLVTPAFHGYDGAIAQALEARGHEVIVHRYDEHEWLPARVGHHLRHQVPRRLGLSRGRRLRATRTDAALAVVRAAAPEVVVVVKGDQFTPALWDELDARRRVLGLYDALRRTDLDIATLRRVGPVASYSPRDTAALRADGLPVVHLPLAYDHRLLPDPPPRTRDEVVFVGARYPGRERALLGLLETGIPARAFGRDWSTHPVDRLRTLAPRRPPVPSGRDLGRVDTYRRMAGAAATLNIHGDQDGFTMRTFEACGVGGVQLLDRTDVTDLYEPGVDLATWSTPEELAELCRRALRDRLWADSLRTAGRKRTLAEHTFDHRVAVLESLWD
jgi:spore maturation protein CgeB